MDTTTIIGIDLGTTNSEVAVIKDGRAVVLEENGEAILPFGGWPGPAGATARRYGRAEPVRSGAGAHDPVDQAQDGPGDDGRPRRQSVLAAGDLSDHPEEAQGARRASARAMRLKRS